MSVRRAALVGLVLTLSAPALAQGQMTIAQLCDPAFDKGAVLSRLPADKRAELEAQLAVLCEQMKLPDKPVHDMADADPDATHKDWTYHARFSADGKWIASAGFDQTVKLWDSQTGKLIRNVATAQGYQRQGKTERARYRDVVFLPDGKRIAAAADGHPVQITSIATGEVLKTLVPRSGRDWPSALRIAVSKSGLLFATGIERATIAGRETDGRVILWRLESGEKVAEFPIGKESPGAIAFSADGKRVAVAAGGTALIWSLAERKAVQSIQVHPMFSIFGLALNRDGTQLITCRSHPELWDVATGKRVRHYGPFTDLCHSVDFDPQEKFAVTTSMGSDVRIWEIATGTFHRRLGRDVKPPR